VISIVTVVLDAREALAATLESVLEQDYGAVEYIVIDGGSTDGTLEVLEAFGQRLSFWLSEPDEGIYDAMNKGIVRATGDVVGILNAGDTYTPGALSEIARVFRRYGADRIYYGDALMQFVEMDLELYSHADIRRLRFKCSLPHESVFVPLAIYEAAGLYTLRYRLAGDYDFLASQLFGGRRFHHVERALSVYRTDGRSSDLAGMARYRRELVDFHLSNATGHGTLAAFYGGLELLHRCAYLISKWTLGRRVADAIRSWHLRRLKAYRAPDREPELDRTTRLDDAS
jgi:glycosyltransferase involved in cell wall biosynthesis